MKQTFRPFADRPRPVRTAADASFAFTQSLFAPAIAEMDLQGLPMAEIHARLLEHPSVGTILQRVNEHEGGVHPTLFMLTEVLFAMGAPVIFEIDPALAALLMATDFSEDHPVPASFVRAPLRGSMFIHLPSPPSALQVGGDQDPLPLSGYFLREVARGTQRELEVVCVSQPPRGVATTDSDNFLWTDIPIVDELRSIPSLFEEADRQSRAAAGAADRPTMRAAMLPHLVFLTKLLVYIGMREVRREAHADKTEALRAAKHLGARKREAAEARASSLWNYTRICADAGDETAQVGVGTSPTVHHRRGHFRLQACGLGRVDRRLVWVRPTIVGFGAPADGARRFKVL